GGGGTARRGVSRMATRPEGGRRYENDRTFDALERFEAAARARSVDTATLALAWLLADPRVSSVIVGPRRPEHLAPARRALEMKLGASRRAELSDVFSLSPT